jgi:polysaccharide pyruvyl transferase WcaK-like protein
MVEIMAEMKSMESSKRIGLAGWWGGQNIGDEYIKYSLRKVLENHFKLDFIEVPFDPTFWNLWKINNLDFLIIGGGGLFTKTPPHPFEIFNKWGHHLKIPFGFLGVGVQEIRQEYKSIIESLVERGAFFVVRDTGSFNLLNSFISSPKIMKAPDLTFLYPYQTRSNVAKDKIGVNLRVWNFDKGRTYDNYKWCQEINRLEGVKKTVPLSFMENLDDREALAGLRGIKESDFNIKLYEDINIMIGMRLHSLIFAAQNSIPSIGIAYTPKVERFFSDLNLNEFCLNVSEYSRLSETFQEVSIRHKEISKKLQQYTVESNIAIANCLESIKNIVKNGR